MTNSLVGPYPAGVLLLLACESAGGKPVPELTWYRGSGGDDSLSLLGDETYVQHIVVGGGGGVNGSAAAEAVLVRKEVRLRVGREHLSEKLYCKVNTILWAQP